MRLNKAKGIHWIECPLLLYLPHQLATLIGGLGIILIRTQLDMASVHGGDFLWAFSQADTQIQACPSWATATEAIGRDSSSMAAVLRRKHPGPTRCCAEHRGTLCLLGYLVPGGETECKLTA